MCIRDSPYTNAELILKAINFTGTQSTSFWAAANVSGEPQPLPGGSAESMLLTGLDTSKMYYFALVSYDSAGNVSAISNVVTAKGAAVEKSEEKVLRFEISGMYPNPFNPSTNIHFSLPRSANLQKVVIKIMDVSGKVVRVFKREGLSGGNYKQAWNGYSQSGNVCGSGLFIVQILSGAHTAQSRMVLAR